MTEQVFPDAEPELLENEHRPELRALIVTGLGLNCEVETAAAVRLAGAEPDLVHLNDLLDGSAERRLSDYRLLFFIGGFAFGDHVAAGFVFANKIRHRLYDDLLAFIDRGGLALGVCNGFQTMVRLGMLPGLDGDYRTPRATLAPNDHPGYRDAWVRLLVDGESPCVWTCGLERIELPARHGEGKFLCESDEVLGRVEAAGQVVVRYADDDWRPTERWPENPNGSPGGVAGICDPSGRLFGLMPHPDAHLYPWQHPGWQRQALDATLPEEGTGMAIFRNGVRAARGGSA
jgi:phosphoribosylformylglycinamidine synthase